MRAGDVGRGRSDWSGNRQSHSIHKMNIECYKLETMFEKKKHVQITEMALKSTKVTEGLPCMRNQNVAGSAAAGGLFLRVISFPPPIFCLSYLIKVEF